MAVYLAEEAAMPWHNQENRVLILAGARTWHQKCKGECMCGCGEEQRGILSYLWPFRRAS